MACAILQDFKKIAVRFVDESEIRVFATASLRNIQKETGLPLDVIDGKEEAALGFAGASHYAPCENGN